MADPFAGLPRGHYGAILADPPWPFATWSHIGLAGDKTQANRTQRSRAAPYQTMDHNDINSLPVADLAAKDCVLFLWVVQTQLPHALRLIEAWGFEFKTCAFAWMKGDGLSLFPDDVVTKMGCGYWTRAEFEQCWLATRGKPRRLNADVRQCLIEKRREHSRKPDGIHERIERLVAGPYLELFARQKRAGWDVWGNETDKFAPMTRAEMTEDSRASYDEALRAMRERR